MLLRIIRVKFITKYRRSQSPFGSGLRIFYHLHLQQGQV